MNPVLQSLDDAICLFYPRLCLACGKQHLPSKQILCTTCEFLLPRTDFHLFKENDFTRKVWGRVDIQTGTSLFHFLKESKTQNLIHNLKYRGKKEVGVILGKMLGKTLIKSELYQNIDLIVPIPLHFKKEIKRGFNQSDVFARGLSETMKIPWAKDALERKIFTETQTQKSRIERFQNVIKAFKVKRPELLRNKHILLVDDVLTTGATLEAGAIKILKVRGTKVSLATIAFAKSD
jgi:ComF family protein